MSRSLVPRLSAYDPAAEGEGSIDPLGLEAIAERLAEQLLPGMTARMYRVRALTFMAVSSHVIEPYVNEYTADQTTPAFLVFEWMFAEAMAYDGLSSSALPGIQRAGKIRNGGGRLSGRTYLKSPRALGMHGFYRRLARATRVIDENQSLGENGESLLRAWERDQRLEGFLDGHSAGGKALSSLRRDLENGLRQSKCDLRERSGGGLALRRSLSPSFSGGTRRERKELCRILDENERRQETFARLEEGADAESFADDDEAAMARWIARRAFIDTASSAGALVAYEGVAGLLTEAFEQLLWASSQDQMKPRPIESLVNEREREVARQVPHAIFELSRACDSIALDQSRADLINDFESVRSAADLAKALVSRHYLVQEAKGRQGKRPWFERTERGVIIRSEYGRDEAPSKPDGFVHPTRLRNARFFLTELGR